MNGDTIFAQASARGRAGVAVIRLSGPDAIAAVAALGGTAPEPRRAALRTLRAPDGAVIDRALVLTFPGPASFTGEDVAELQVHGSPAVARLLGDLLGRQPGLRVAEPGEFTRRALANGRLDLAQVEGLGDLLAAETAAQHRQAMRLMEGGLSRRAAGWRERLVRALAFVEAAVDFADEELPDAVELRAGPLLAAVAAEMADELGRSRVAERLRDGFEVALVGRPNVGKSTLLNALAGREAALTSAVAGTTRDVIEVRLDLDGLPVTLLDMAGLRDGGDVIEALGIARARARAEAADLRIFLVDEAADIDAIGVTAGPDDIVALAKADQRAAGGALAVSGATGFGIEALLGSVAAVLSGRAATAGTLSHERQRQAVAAAAAALGRAELLLADGSGPELVAAEVQDGLRSLDFLVGRTDVEAVLDVIFASFCLGK